MSGYGLFAKYYDALTANIDYVSRAVYFDGILKQYSDNAMLVLDLACGTGKLSFALQDLGYEVIGADASAEMLSVAMQKNCDSPEKILFLNQEMDKLDLYGTVDATICALDSVNHVAGKEKLEAAFKRVGLFTNPGGLFIFDVNTPHKHRDILGSNMFAYDLPEVFCCWRNDYNSDSGRVDITLDFFAPDGGGRYTRETESFSEYIYDDGVLLKMLSNAGFKHVATFDDDSFDAPAMTSQRLVYVAKKL